MERGVPVEIQAKVSPVVKLFRSASRRPERAGRPMPLVFLLIFFELSARQWAAAKEYWEGLAQVALGAGFGGARVAAMG
jgi:hypothetical protein